MKKILMIAACLIVTGAPVVNAEIPEQGQEQASAGSEGAAAAQPPACMPISAFSTHHTNYLAFYHWPLSDSAQIKYQFSAKYKVMNEDADLGRFGTLAGYFAYTQKSFWSIGEPSRPFQESNYNPEAFLSISPELRYRRFTLHEVRLSPYEHESNGLDGVDSRSWDRRYVEVIAGYGPALPYRTVDAFTRDRVELNVKIWHAFGYYEQNDYLRSLGSSEDFLDYEGHGVLRLKVRNLMPWSWDNQIDLSTRLFHAAHRDNYQIEYQQYFPHLNFSLYVQYWGGYDESLLRFEKLGRKLYLGLSFCY